MRTNSIRLFTLTVTLVAAVGVVSGLLLRAQDSKPAAGEPLPALPAPPGFASPGISENPGFGHLLTNETPDHAAGGSETHGETAEGGRLSPQQRAVRATVRLTIDTKESRGNATGTIIGAYRDKALVVTAGHLFRDSGGKGKLTVELCGVAGAAPLDGELIGYDGRDPEIAFVAFRPRGNVVPVPLAPGQFRAARQMPVFRVGCERGGDARAREGRVSEIDRYVGPANIEVSGMPLPGCSGGGLFTAEGLLIGVCLAADPGESEGLFAASSAIHDQLAAAQNREGSVAHGELLLATTPGEFADTRPAVPPGHRVATVRVSDTFAPELLLPGDRVDILVFLHKGDEVATSRVRTLLTDVRVTEANDDRRRITGEDPTSGDGPTVSVLVTPKQLEMLILAAELGSIHVSLRSQSDVGAGQSRGTDMASLLGVDDAAGSLPPHAPSDRKKTVSKSRKGRSKKTKKRK